MPTETEHARRLPTIPSGLWSRDARQTKYSYCKTSLVYQVKSYQKSLLILQNTRNPRYHCILSESSGMKLKLGGNGSSYVADCKECMEVFFTLIKCDITMYLCNYFIYILYRDIKHSNILWTKPGRNGYWSGLVGENILFDCRRYIFGMTHVELQLKTFHDQYCPLSKWFCIASMMQGGLLL
jgi:hypothetical protein